MLTEEKTTPTRKPRHGSRVDVPSWFAARHNRDAPDAVLSAGILDAVGHGADAGAAPARFPSRRRVGAGRTVLKWAATHSRWRFAYPVSDVIMLSAAVSLTVNWPGDAGVRGEIVWPLLCFPWIVVVLFAVRGQYRGAMRTSLMDHVGPILATAAMGTLAVTIASVYVVQTTLEPGVAVHLWALSVALVVTGRVGLAFGLRAARRHDVLRAPTLIIGAGVVGTKIAGRLQDRPEYGLRPVGFLDSDPPPETIDSRSVPVLGTVEDLESIARSNDVTTVVLAFSTDSDDSLVSVVRRCREFGLEVLLVPRLFESYNDRTSYEPLGGLPMLVLKVTNPHGWEFAVKHGSDRVCAAIGLFLLAPLLALIAIGVKLGSPGPVFFRQPRVGRDGHAFELLKFRSMTELEPGATGFAPAAGRAPGGVEGIDRRTPLGRVLRRTSLDELPQLVNVLLGDMSLIGPRPERPEFVERFDTAIDRYGDRHRVKSGITGWAQVHGLRGQTSLPDRVEWDNYYIEHWSLALDLKILALTVPAVLHRAE
jgi:exopolysaccharide biosynthesis polyprenyl glycosylphosphotransferase